VRQRSKALGGSVHCGILTYKGIPGPPLHGNIRELLLSLRTW
jgi:hypothetical protein